jgi:beta-phosphoglucomutase-like phosphatase (HAD superfamily)
VQCAEQRPERVANCCVFFGGSVADIDAGSEAGIPVVVCTDDPDDGGLLLRHGAEAIICTLADLDRSSAQS